MDLNGSILVRIRHEKSLKSENSLNKSDYISTYQIEPRHR